MRFARRIAIRFLVLSFLAGTTSCVPDADGDGIPGDDPWRPLVEPDLTSVTAHADDAATIEFDKALLQKLPVWQVKKTLTIGEAQTGDNYLFHIAGMPRHLRNGDIVVPNQQAHIRWYDSTGRYLRTVGQKGEGPGDFGQLWSLHPVADDSILALDIMSNKMSVYNSSGKFIRWYTVSANASFPIGMHLLGDRSFAFVGGSSLRAVMARGDSGVFLDTLTLRRSRPDTNLIDALRRISGSWRTTPMRKGAGPGQVWYAVGALIAAGDSTVAVGHGDSFTVEWFASSGRRVKAIHIEIPAEPVPAALKKKVFDIIHESYASGRSEDPNAREPAQSSIPFAKHLPLIDRLVVDRIGRTWVRRWVHPDSSNAEWVVLAKEGRPMARCVTIASLSFSDVGENYILGRHTDADGVQSISRFAIQAR